MTAGGLVKTAVLGAGNVGAALVYRLLEAEGDLELALVADIDPAALGLARARRRGVPTSDGGAEAVAADPGIGLVFDATNASAHRAHAPLLRDAGLTSIDLTGGTKGPSIVPAVNREQHLDEDEVGLATPSAQVAVPIVRALADLVRVVYAESVAMVASSSLGPGARASVDELTALGSDALVRLGGAERGKAITVVSPADPPIAVRCAVYAVAEEPFDLAAARAAVDAAVTRLAELVPGCWLKDDPSCEERQTPWGARPTLALNVEIEGTKPPTPHAGGLEAMAATAQVVGEARARSLAGREVA